MDVPNRKLRYCKQSLGFQPIGTLSSSSCSRISPLYPHARMLFKNQPLSGLLGSISGVLQTYRTVNTYIHIQRERKRKRKRLDEWAFHQKKTQPECQSELKPHDPSGAVHKRTTSIKVRNKSQRLINLIWDMFGNVH